MGEPVHIGVIIKEILSNLVSIWTGQSPGKLMLSKLRAEIRKRKIRGSVRELR